jgi:hypothetical protein
MRDSKQKLIYLLWTVIGVLVVGGIIIGFMLVNKTNELSDTNNELTGNNASLREQLRQAKASPTPSPTATPDYSESATPTPVTSPSATPEPKSTSNR